MSDIAEGARVRLKPDTADSWRDPKMRKRAALGTPGRVVCLFAHVRYARVEFEREGRLMAFNEVVPLLDLEVVP